MVELRVGVGSTMVAGCASQGQVERRVLCKEAQMSVGYEEREGEVMLLTAL